MNYDTRRITLVSRHTQLPQRKWNSSQEAMSRLVLLDSFTILHHAVCASIANIEADVERIILDRSTSASDYLALLADLPREFTGDLMMVRDDDTGFLSSMGRGGDRVLYALSSDDVHFYLETHGLVMEGGAAVAAARPFKVLQYRSRVAVA